MTKEVYRLLRVHGSNRFEQLCTIVNNSSSQNSHALHVSSSCSLNRVNQQLLDFGARSLLYRLLLYALIKNRYRITLYRNFNEKIVTKLQFSFFLIFYTLWRYYSKIIFRVERRLDSWTIHGSLEKKVESRLEIL